MKNMLNAMWQEDDGVLSFEWVLLVTLLTIGLVAGIAGMRDAMIDEMGDVAGAAINMDQSYDMPAVDIPVPDAPPGFSNVTAPAQSFSDSLPLYEVCDRSTFGAMPPLNDSDS